MNFSRKIVRLTLKKTNLIHFSNEKLLYIFVKQRLQATNEVRHTTPATSKVSNVKFKCQS